jgi:hypothetical protein
MILLEGVFRGGVLFILPSTRCVGLALKQKYVTVHMATLCSAGLFFITKWHAKILARSSVSCFFSLAKRTPCDEPLLGKRCTVRAVDPVGNVYGVSSHHVSVNWS